VFLNEKTGKVARFINFELKMSEEPGYFEEGFAAEGFVFNTYVPNCLRVIPRAISING
jgi:hypothetical protein